MPADIILYALVAAGLVIWLRNLLGTRHEDEPQRPNPFAETSENKSAAPVAPLAGAQTGVLPDTSAPLGEELERHMAITESAQPGLMDIARIDRGFHVGHFLAGAQDAFVMIVEAFAAHDRETLSNLLHEPVFKAFESVIIDRESRGETGSIEIHAVRRAEIRNAWLDGRMAYVTVRFTADETNVVRDADGEVISGNPDRVTETIDIWTFGRDTRSRDPSWMVYETLDEDAAESDHKVVPDSV